MSHLPAPGVICVAALSLIALASASPLLDQHASECPPGHVKCRCGKGRGKVTVPVKRTKVFGVYREYCDFPESHRKMRRRICPNFKLCTSCDSHGCLTCPDNRYGHLCNKSCSSLCFNGGTCRNNTCVCPPDFTGNRCEILRDKECHVVTKPANGYVTVTEKIATYSCSKGYHLIGQEILNCRSDGTWSSEAPVCEAICQPPTATEHLFFSRQELHEDYEHEGAVMKLAARCDQGYRLVGARSVYCNLDGTWSSLPRCEKRGKCSDPHNIANGSFQFFPSTDEEGYFEGAEVTYECDIGFVLNGSFSVICRENGEWSSQPPRCEFEGATPVRCPPLERPANGSVIPGHESKTHQLVPGVRFVYSCKEGYFLHPFQPARYCQHDGTWMPAEPPRCIPVVTCTDPGPLHHGKRCFGYGCSTSNDPVTFIPTCVSRAEIGDATVMLPEGVHVKDTIVEFTCNARYRKTGPGSIRCQDDGTWTDWKPKCIPECGQVQSGVGLMYHGEQTQVEKWPWHVVIRWTNSNFCGGVLLGDSWVVTAAHCVTVHKETSPLPVSALWAEFGKQFFNESGGKVVRRKISKIKIHMNYLPDTFDSDIALLKLRQPLEMTERIRPVCISKHLPISSCKPHVDKNRSDTIQKCGRGNSNENTPNRSDRYDSYISGFGQTTRNTSDYSQRLRSARLLVESNNTRCMENLRKHNAVTPVTENMFCAGKLSHPCTGDSGGPLVTKRIDDKGIQRWYLQGIVSWGAGNACKIPDSYGVFTNVPKFYDWIQQMTTPDLSHYT